MRGLILLAGSALLIAAAPVTLAPADDPATPAPIGAAARAKNGIEPLARPTDDLGMADDPAEAAVSPAPPAQPKAPTTPVSK